MENQPREKITLIKPEYATMMRSSSLSYKRVGTHAAALECPPSTHQQKLPTAGDTTRSPEPGYLRSHSLSMRRNSAASSLDKARRMEILRDISRTSSRIRRASMSSALAHSEMSEQAMGTSTNDRVDDPLSPRGEEDVSGALLTSGPDDDGQLHQSKRTVQQQQEAHTDRTHSNNSPSVEERCQLDAHEARPKFAAPNISRGKAAVPEIKARRSSLV